MLGTYASTLIVCGAALVIGQAALVVCGWRRWSWLAPAVGVALLLALAWGTVRLPGEAATALVAIVVASAVAAAAVWRAHPEGTTDAVREGGVAALLALAAVSIPFFVEGHFGVLGTSFNPDMGQQLFAADWLADTDRPEPDLLENGYPVGPHALAAALTTVTGGNLVSAFTGVTIAVPVLAALTALVVLRELAPIQRAVGAVLVGIPYLAASYLAQGLFKELLQALFVLAFALCLHELARGEPDARRGRAVFVAVPLGLIALGSVYAYSAPGLAWLGAAAALFAFAQLFRAWRSRQDAGAAVRRAAAPVAVALAVLVAGAAPELGRIVEFRDTAVDVAQAETPEGGGRPKDVAEGEAGAPPEGGGAAREDVEFDNKLGNLFDQISPLEALGIWPSGDFRVEPGDGAAPAALFYLCALLGAAALAVGLVRWWSRGETAIPAALAAALAVYVAARVASTPYTAAKAILMIAPLSSMIAVRGVLGPLRLPPRVSFPKLAPGPPWRYRIRAALPRIRVLGLIAVGIAFAVGAAASTLLALVNAPVGPREYSSGLAELRSRVSDAGVLVLAPRNQIAEERAEEFIGWELRGVDLEVESGGGETRVGPPPPGIAYVITGRAGPNPPYEGAELEKRRDPYRLWRVTEN